MEQQESKSDRVVKNTALLFEDEAVCRGNFLKRTE